MYASNPTFAKQVTIAKVDATMNDVPEEIQGFPTIKLFPAGAKGAPSDYNGDRTIEDLAQFVKEKGKYKVDVMAGRKTAADKEGDVEMPDAEEMGQAAKAATKKAGDAVTDATKKAGDAATAASKKAGDAAEAATEKAGDATDAASSATEEAKESATNMKETIKSKASEVVQAAKTALVDSDGDKAEHDEL